MTTYYAKPLSAKGKKELKLGGYIKRGHRGFPFAKPHLWKVLERAHGLKHGVDFIYLEERRPV